MTTLAGTLGSGHSATDHPRDFFFFRPKIYPTGETRPRGSRIRCPNWGAIGEILRYRGIKKKKKISGT